MKKYLKDNRDAERTAASQKLMASPESQGTEAAHPMGTQKDSVVPVVEFRACDLLATMDLSDFDTVERCSRAFSDCNTPAPALKTHHQVESSRQWCCRFDMKYDQFEIGQGPCLALPAWLVGRADEVLE